MVKYHLVLHHASENIFNKYLQDRLVNSGSQAIFVRKDFVKHVSWSLQRNQNNILNANQVIERELESTGCLFQVLQEQLNLIMCFWYSKRGILLLEL